MHSRAMREVCQLLFKVQGVSLLKHKLKRLTQMSLTLETVQILVRVYFLQEGLQLSLNFHRGLLSQKSEKTLNTGILEYNPGHSQGKKRSLDSRVRPKDPGKIILQPSGITQAFLR